MKKYILILLLVSQFGNAQYNLFVRQNFAKTISGFNTQIGGVSATLSSASLLATKLGISSSRISNFTIVGSDIKCRISGSYAIPAVAFNVNSAITYYTDSDNLVTDLGTQAFAETPNMYLYRFDGIVTLTGQDVFTIAGLGNYIGVRKEIYLKNCTSVTQRAFYGMNYCGFNIYIPNCATLGSTTGNNSVFQSINTPQNIKSLYLKPSLATAQGGSEEGDVAYARTVGMNVSYVANFTAPNQITDASVGTIYNQQFQVNFTTPSSANAIQYYEVYKDGIFVQQITNGGYINNLTASTSYSGYTIVAVDIYLNRSIPSNPISATTNTTWYPLTSVVSYYKLESSSVDAVGSNNGTDTSVSYGTGKIGNAAIYNGTTSYASLGNAASLQIGVGTIACYVKASASGSSFRGIIAKGNAYSIYLQDGIFIAYNFGSFGGTGAKSSGVNLNDGLWHHVMFIFDTGTNNNYLYVDNVLKQVFSWSINNQSSAAIIAGGNPASQLINASIDSAIIFNKKLDENERNSMFNRLSAGTEIIP